MGLSNDQLIAEAILVNHARVGKQATLDEYRRSLGHFSEYLASSHGETFYSARRKHVLLFMAHLEKQGGAKPDESRLLCGWRGDRRRCVRRLGFDGTATGGWGAGARRPRLDGRSRGGRYGLWPNGLGNGERLRGGNRRGGHKGTKRRGGRQQMSARTRKAGVAAPRSPRPMAAPVEEPESSPESAPIPEPVAPFDPAPTPAAVEFGM